MHMQISIIVFADATMPNCDVCPYCFIPAAITAAITAPFTAALLTIILIIKVCQAKLRGSEGGTKAYVMKGN